MNDTDMFEKYKDVLPANRQAVYEVLKAHFGDKPQQYAVALQKFNAAKVYFDSYSDTSTSWATVLRSLSNLAQISNITLMQQGEINALIVSVDTIEAAYKDVLSKGCERATQCLELWDHDFGSDFQRRIEAVECLNWMVKCGDDLPLEELKKYLPVDSHKILPAEGAIIMAEVLFGNLEKMGIAVWIEDGKIVSADEQERSQTVDTPENRKIAIKQAKALVKEWEAGR